MGLFDIFSGDPQKDAAQQRIAGIQAGQAAATGAIDRGLSDLRGYYNTADNYYAPLSEAAGRRSSAYDDATGVNGAEGLARARATFVETPGYREGIDIGLDALDRRAAARGQLASGNTSADTLKYASDYANQKYNDYVSQLAPYVGSDASIANMRAGLQTALGDKSYEAGVAKGGIGYQSNVGIGNANADAALADYNASGNLWNTLLGVGKVAASFNGRK